MSVFAELRTLPLLTIWEGAVGRAVHGERLTLSVVELDGNAVIPQHSHENEQVGMVLAGSVIFRVDKEVRELTAGGTWCVAANTPHDVKTGAGGAVVIEAFSPCRNDWRTLHQEPACPPRWPAIRQ
jgi:quercetin dioxygenase-like cupin family protein